MTLSYAEARKRGFKAPVVVIQHRVADRRAGANRAEVASQRAMESSQHSDERSTGAEQAAAGAVAVAEAAKACAEKAEGAVKTLATEVNERLGKVDETAKAAAAQSGHALEAVAQVAAKVESNLAGAGEAKESAGQAGARAASAESVARDARVRSLAAEQRSVEVSERVKAAAALAQQALTAAQDRGEQVTGIKLESRSLVVSFRGGREERIGLPDERRVLSRARGGSGVGGGLNRKKVIELIEERMLFTEVDTSLADQTSDGSVLTFTFASAVDKVWVELHETAVDDTSTARVRTGGTAPDADEGVLIHAGVPHAIADNTTVVKVLAGNTKVVSVWGYRR